MIKEDFESYVNGMFDENYERSKEGLKKLDNTLKELKGKICMEFSVPMTNVNVTTKFFSMSDKHYCFIYASIYSDKLYSETICVEVV